MKMLSIKEIVEISKKVHDSAMHDEKVSSKIARDVNTVANMAVELVTIRDFAENCLSGKGTDYSLHVKFDEKRARKNMGLEEAEAETLPKATFPKEKDFNNGFTKSANEE